METTSTHNEDGMSDDRMDNNRIYGGENDDDDGDFTYHSSDLGQMANLRLIDKRGNLSS